MNIENEMIFVILREFVASSSSESESESDDENNRCIECARIPKIQNYIDDVVSIYNELQFKETFRLRRGTFQYLLNLIRADLESYHGRMTIDPEKQLYVALYVLGTPDSNRSITTKFGVGKATAWRAV
ncbi:uncharacterized protein LOC117175612, partial [Belonocnema kinseyi]|uniref:uncharacterized protein LOC117175612 n=1 Tax=Belonocnema kinseyi TaxID=2817044 RepID=UPI00143DED23